MILGSHVSMKAPNYVLGSVQEALSYGANALMLYTGAPQNTLRKPVEDLRIPEAQALMKKEGISLDHFIVHSPYIINLANVVKPDIFELGVRFLKEELQRTEDIGARYLVLHPGSYTTTTLEEGLASITQGLNQVLQEDQTQVTILLETMAGKGSECGTTLEQLATIEAGIQNPQRVGICLDTCHLHDAGYEVQDFDRFLNELDACLGLDQVHCVHLNDSKNEKGAHKDRHANLGKGFIGDEILKKIAQNPRLAKIPKILETPWIDGVAPYKEEIAFLRENG